MLGRTRGMIAAGFLITVAGGVRAQTPAPSAPAWASPFPAAAAAGYEGIPADAKILEEADLTGTEKKDRRLVLWMIGPTRTPRAEGEPYTCPDYSRGHHHSGPTRLSLVDSASRKSLHMLEIRNESGEDTFDVPYRIESGHYYAVPGAGEGQEGTPRILDLKDLTGDGKALELCFYDSQACTDPSVAVIGFLEDQDRLVQYAVHLTEETGVGDPQTWIAGLFTHSPPAPGQYRHEVDERGRGGALCQYDVKFVPGNNRFEGSIACEE